METQRHTTYEDTFKQIDEMIKDEEYENAILHLKIIYENDENINVRYFACIKLANIYLQDYDDFDRALPWLMKSYSEFQRIEGLICVVKYYMSKQRYMLGYSLCLVCLFTDKFENIGCSDFIYEFERHYLLAQLCLHMKRFEECNSHVKKAIEGLKEDFDMYEEYLLSCRDIFEKSAEKMRIE